MPKLDFVPGRDGFHFDNHFVNHVLDGPVRIETYGRCGGMAAAAIDYRRTSIPIPTHVEGDLPNGIPAEGTPLSTFIYDRLLSTILRPEGMKFVLGPWVSDADCYRWSMNDEFPKFRRRVDAGMLSIVGLWSREAGVGNGHQVVCYGYEVDPPALLVYDNNHHDQECRLVGLGPDQGVAIVHANGQNQFRGYFLHDIIDYGAPAPRPPYIDLGVSAGITLEPGGEVVQGQRLVCSVTVRNYGTYPARLRGLIIFLRGPGGQNLDGILGGLDNNASPIVPGEERVLRREVPAFDGPLGDYVVGVSYLSEQDNWRILPPGPGVQVETQRQFRVLRPGLQLLVQREIGVAEADHEVDTGIDLQPGDEVAFDAWDTIWSGVWLTERNGPAGWSNVDHDPKFPLHQGPDAHPYALIGRYDGLDWFRVGDGRAREPYSGGNRRRVFLRTNDDMPGNGNGAFICRVSVWR
jgi:hypothetical protein